MSWRHYCRACHVVRSCAMASRCLRRPACLNNGCFALNSGVWFRRRPYSKCPADAKRHTKTTAVLCRCGARESCGMSSPAIGKSPRFSTRGTDRIRRNHETMKLVHLTFRVSHMGGARGGGAVPSYLPPRLPPFVRIMTLGALQGFSIFFVKSNWMFWNF